MLITVLTYTPLTPGTIAHPRRHGTDTRERGVALYTGVMHSVLCQAKRSSCCPALRSASWPTPNPATP